MFGISTRSIAVTIIASAVIILFISAMPFTSALFNAISPTLGQSLTWYQQNFCWIMGIGVFLYMLGSDMPLQASAIGFVATTVILYVLLNLGVVHLGW